MMLFGAGYFMLAGRMHDVSVRYSEHHYSAPWLHKALGVVGVLSGAAIIWTGVYFF